MSNELELMVNEEIRNRIKVSVYAYSYEMEAISLVDDAAFDKAMSSINKETTTGHEVLDKFFASDKFDPSSGQFIHSHPELRKVKEVYDRYFKENS